MRPERALDQFQRMLRQSVVCNVVVYGTVLSACEQGHL